MIRKNAIIAVIKSACATFQAELCDSCSSSSCRRTMMSSWWSASAIRRLRHHGGQPVRPGGDTRRDGRVVDGYLHLRLTVGDFERVWMACNARAEPVDQVGRAADFDRYMVSAVQQRERSLRNFV